MAYDGTAVGDHESEGIPPDLLQKLYLQRDTRERTVPR